jgi:hypothetical protein
MILGSSSGSLIVSSAASFCRNQSSAAQRVHRKYTYPANRKSLSAFEEVAARTYNGLVDLVRVIAADDYEIGVFAGIEETGVKLVIAQARGRSLRVLIY